MRSTLVPPAKVRFHGPLPLTSSRPKPPSAPPSSVCTHRPVEQLLLSNQGSRAEGTTTPHGNSSRNSRSAVAMPITEAHSRSTQGPMGTQREWSLVLRCCWIPIPPTSSWPGTFQGKGKLWVYWARENLRSPQTHSTAFPTANERPKWGLKCAREPSVSALYLSGTLLLMALSGT